MSILAFTYFMLRQDYDQMGMWATFAPQLVELTASGALKDTAVLVEGLGTLALLTPDDLEEVGIRLVRMHAQIWITIPKARSRLNSVHCLSIECDVV